MDTIQSWQIKSIYALGGGLGMVERGNAEDALHTLVSGISGKTSVKELDQQEATAIIVELQQRMKLKNHTAPLSKPKKEKIHTEIPGGVSSAQQKKAWRLMYEIEKFDLTPSTATVQQRLRGLIEKQFKVTTFAQEPFRFLSTEQGAQLIEGLKSIATKAELKYLHSSKYRENKAGGGM
ncbi:MAG: regulatory protein GemA [Ruthenibacterium sp.]